MSIIQTRTGVAIAAAALAIAALVGCASPSATPPAEAPTSAPAADPSSALTLATADSSLGQVVVDGDGMTVYVFDHDTQGATSSACSGGCAAQWPAVHGDDTAALDGVTGELGTITGTDGQPQVTLNGWPLYYYAGDSTAGDVNGQGVGGIWWAVGPDGSKVGSPDAAPDPYGY